MTEPQPVRLERRGAVALVTLDNPPLNLLSSRVKHALGEAFEQIGADEALRAVVLTGAGGRAFSAGSDVREFPDNEARGRTMSRLEHDLYDRIDGFPRPVLAALDAPAFGGGLELAMACDVRVAAEDAQLGQPEIKLGLIPGGGGTQRLPRLVGHGRALLLNLTGDPISGAQAYDWGLVERAVPRAELHDAVMGIARTLSERSPHSMAVIKALAAETRDLPLGEGMQKEAQGFMRCIGSEDGAEGVMAFLEKRTARFTGR